MLYGYIYKITNLHNGKLYIGLCTTSIQQRWQAHIRDSRKLYLQNRPLYNAIRKYGEDSFLIEEIEKCEISQLPEREKYWIAFYNSYKNGYNATLGGEGKPLFDHEKIYERLLEYPYPSEIAKEFGCSSDTVRDIAKTHNIKVLSKGQEFLSNQKKQVQGINKITRETITFDSTVNAAKWCFEQGFVKTLNSGVRSHISDCANGKRKTAYGFYWEYI